MKKTKKETKKMNNKRFSSIYQEWLEFIDYTNKTINKIKKGWE